MIATRFGWSVVWSELVVGEMMGVTCGVRAMRSGGASNIPVRQQPALAARAFAMHEAGISLEMIAMSLRVSEGNAINLIGYGRRLAAGQREPMEELR